MNTNNYVNISPEELIRVVDVCLFITLRSTETIGLHIKRNNGVGRKMRYVWTDYLDV